MTTCIKCGIEISQEHVQQVFGLCFECNDEKSFSIPSGLHFAPKHTKIPIYGVTAFIADVIAGILISFFQNTLNIFYATPFAAIAILCGIIIYKSQKYFSESYPAIALIGGVIGIILLLISIWPPFLILLA